MIIFVVLTDSQTLTKVLPRSVRKIIESGKSKVTQMKSIAGGDATLAEFPYLPTTHLNYSPELVNAMSQLACWQIMQCEDQLREMGIITRKRRRTRTDSVEK